MLEFEGELTNQDCQPLSFLTNIRQFLKSQHLCEDELTLALVDLNSADEEKRYNCFHNLISIHAQISTMPTLNDKDIKKFANHVYDQFYDFGVWFYPLYYADLTFNATVILLSYEELVVINRANQKLINFAWRVKRGASMFNEANSWLHQPLVWSSLSESEQSILTKIILRINDASSTILSKEQRSFFVKLSTRSPKDSLILTHRKELLVKTAHHQECLKKHNLEGMEPKNPNKKNDGKQIFTNQPPPPPTSSRLGKISDAFLNRDTNHMRLSNMLGNNVAEENNNSNMFSDDNEDELPQNILEECSLKSMLNMSGAEAFDLLLTSTRIQEDITKYIENENKWQHLPFSCSTPIEIILRPWENIPRYSELRGFIYKRKLTALSQYYTSEHFPELWLHQTMISENAIDYVDRWLGPCMPMENAVVDLIWTPSGVEKQQQEQNEAGGSNNARQHSFRVIELNPFGKSTGAALFHWTQDRDVLFGDAPFECRISDERGLSRWETQEETLNSNS